VQVSTQASEDEEKIVSTWAAVALSQFTGHHL